LHRPRDVRAIGIVSEVPQRRAIGEAAAPVSASERMSNAAASESKQRHRPQAKARGRGLGVRAAPEVERRRDAKGEGIPGRGSSVSFTRCEVSRSWLDGVTRSLHRQRVRFRRATGVSDVARVISDSAGRKRPFRARAETTEARNGVVKRRPHRFTPRPSRVEGVNAETAQIRVPD
jgi:hypothetical protein